MSSLRLGMGMVDYISYIFVFCLVVGVPLIYLKRHRRSLNDAERRLTSAQEAGLTEPVSLHPKIDRSECIFCGSCFKACPEGEILGFVNGRVQLVTPTKCIGHGACMTACPVGAISLVFGTEKRGVEIPHVSPTFETNVPGVYIAGELGGMGLIRNAVTQGRGAMESIVKSINGSSGGATYDVAIIGAGPSGLSASLQAKKAGLKYITLEQEGSAGGTVLSFPRQKLVMTQPMEFPIYGKFNRREILKEELMSLFNDVISKCDIEITGNSKVESVNGELDSFEITTTTASYTAKRVLLSIGRRGTPRKLGVDGELSTKVAYKLLEPEQFKNKHILVVGGGDSAVEAAIALGEQEGTTVSLSYRKPSFSRIKSGNQTRIDGALKAGWVVPYFESQVKEIFADKVTLKYQDNIVTLENDHVFVFIGGELPTKFLNSIGVEMEMKHGVS